MASMDNGTRCAMLTMWTLVSPQRAALRFLVAAAPRLGAPPHLAPLSAGHGRAAPLPDIAAPRRGYSSFSRPVAGGSRRVSCARGGLPPLLDRICCALTGSSCSGVVRDMQMPSATLQTRSALGHMCLLIPLQLAALQGAESAPRTFCVRGSLAPWCCAADRTCYLCSGELGRGDEAG